MSARLEENKISCLAVGLMSASPSRTRMPRLVGTAKNGGRKSEEVGWGERREVGGWWRGWFSQSSRLQLLTGSHFALLISSNSLPLYLLLYPPLSLCFPSHQVV